MPARLDDLLAQAEHSSGDGPLWARVRRSEFPVIRQAVSEHAHEWLGHSVAIFGCNGLGLLEMIPMRGHVRKRAMAGDRPYVRPLLAELQRSPSYVAAVVDRRHAWLFRISGEGTDPLGHVQDQTAPSRRYAGWHGFHAYRNQQRARKLAHQHYAATVAALTEASNEGDCAPIAVGGHEAAAGEFLAVLPSALREPFPMTGSGPASAAADAVRLPSSRVRVRSAVAPPTRCPTSLRNLRSR
jgi:Bacterial archaeo-eukaryotic release factor family 10